MKKYNFISLALALSAVPAIAQISETPKTLSELKALSGEAKSIDLVPLGTAYQSKGDVLLGLQSVQGTAVEHLGNTNIDFRVGVDLSYEQALKLIDGKVDAGFKFPAVRVDAGANYAKDISADRYTGTYSVYSSVKPKSRILMPTGDAGYQPTQAAKELAQAYPGNKAANLGDGFVQGFAYGSNVVINMKIEYRNEQDKRKIGGYLSVDWIGKVKVDGQLQKIDEEKRQSVKISISGYQSGGDPNRLLNIIPNGIMRCTLLNPEPCFNLFEAAVNYLKTDYINQFDSLDDYNITESYITKYLDSGAALQQLIPDAGYTPVNYLTKLVIKELTARWIEERLTYRRAKNLQRYYAAQFSPEQLNQLQQIESSSRANANLFADMVDYCERNPEGNYCIDYESGNLAYYRDYSAISDVLK
ncbi:MULTISPECIES: hypothetical protein [Pseudoalteromonas]|uniref:Uncharacterized protein n=1 Tax=Pseudoalteromonas luteoviolacea (strain 2ta16) TaxID=1353533 RepID=V4HKL1_PSEL2|nr:MULTISPECIES: hypothetical protein [Pseudoalteromonas]ESP91340.1 hypothetical protein PL2TA16_00888 [Pseudoalteromonas luteoviolacea 2ta16]KZN39660.1 hypothetical protein N483_19260 [Pseudoalteromonas luteoviolacea NCIMB 1944]MCG7551026.1 hypothetical protein [Pseudoalteromonas sp. Of7M-16]